MKVNPHFRFVGPINGMMAAAHADAVAAYARAEAAELTLLLGMIALLLLTRITY